MTFSQEAQHIAKEQYGKETKPSPCSNLNSNRTVTEQGNDNHMAITTADSNDVSITLKQSKDKQLEKEMQHLATITIRLTLQKPTKNRSF